MNFLDDSDLVIVIVDNKDGINDGTQTEINRMKALEKKCIYFYCDEREKEATELEKEIRKLAEELNFEKAIQKWDEMKELKELLLVI